MTDTSAPALPLGSAIAEVDAMIEWGAQMESEVPCDVVATLGRRLYCGRADEHTADWEVLWSDGDALYYCDASFESLVHGERVSGEGGHRIHPILERRLH